MKHWFYYFTKLTVWLIFRVGHGLEVTGQEQVPRTGGVILASNHLSFIDPPVLGAACPRRIVFMARRNLFSQPLLGAFMRGVHVIPLARGEADVSAIRAATLQLRSGNVVTIFPEGTRQLSGRLGVAKRGVGLLAAAAKVPIVPVLVQGTFQALPPDAKRLRPGKIRVAFGTPIPYTTPSTPSIDSSTEEGTTGRAEGSTSRTYHERLAAAVTAQWRQLEARQSGTR